MHLLCYKHDILLCCFQTSRGFEDEFFWLGQSCSWSQTSLFPRPFIWGRFQPYLRMTTISKKRKASSHLRRLAAAPWGTDSRS